VLRRRTKAHRLPLQPEISKARTLPGSFCTSRSVYDELTETVLAPFWQFIGATEDFAEASSAWPVEFSGGSLIEPLL